jgi:hypothetical protein
VFLLKGVEGVTGGGVEGGGVGGEGLGVVDVKYCCKRCDGSGVGGLALLETSISGIIVNLRI